MASMFNPNIMARSSTGQDRDSSRVDIGQWPATAMRHIANVEKICVMRLQSGLHLPIN
jgi:hypothetical protein